MPQKYRVELSDGRKFEVEADAPPSEQDVLSALEPQKSHAAAPSQPQGSALGRFTSGVLRTTTSSDQPVSDFMSGASYAVQHPGDTLRLPWQKLLGEPENKQSILTQTTKQNPAIQRGDYAGAAGEAVGAIGSLLLGTKAAFKKPAGVPFNELPLYKQMDSLPTEPRGPMPVVARAPEPPLRGVGAASSPLSDVQLAEQEAAAGRLPQSVVDAMKRGPSLQRGTLRTIAPTEGNLALKTENALAPPVSAAKTVPSGFNPRPNPIDQMVATQSRNEAFDRVAQKQGMAQPNAMTPMAQRAIESLPNRLTPEQMDRLPSYAEQMRNPDRHGQLGSDWMSFAEPGSADAQRAAASHKYQGEMDSRWRYLMDSENGFIAPELLHLLGVGAGYGGVYGAVRTAKALAPHAGAMLQSPQFQQAVRAAILAQLASRGAPDASRLSTPASQ